MENGNGRSCNESHQCACTSILIQVFFGIYTRSPITNKVFTNSSHVVAIATSGNIYAYSAVNELNLKAKNFSDLISGEPFRRSDIITVQDPQNAEQTAKRDISNFSHLKTVREESSESRKSESKIRQSVSTSSVMKEIESQRQIEKESGVKRKTLEEIISSAGSEDNSDVDRFLALNPLTLDVTPGQVNTDGRASSSLTSTSSNLWTSNATRKATAEEIREARWKIMRKVLTPFVPLCRSSGSALALLKPIAPTKTEQNALPFYAVACTFYGPVHHLL